MRRTSKSRLGTPMPLLLRATAPAVSVHPIPHLPARDGVHAGFATTHAGRGCRSFTRAVVGKGTNTRTAPSSHRNVEDEDPSRVTMQVRDSENES